MAALVVAGAAALLLQARPTLTPNQVKALLMGTDKPVSGTKVGTGMIDVERASTRRPSPCRRSTSASCRTR